MFWFLPLSLSDRIWSYSSRIFSSRSFNNRAQIILTCLRVKRCWLDDDECPGKLIKDVESVVDWWLSSSVDSDEFGFNWFRRCRRRTSSLIRLNKSSNSSKRKE
jgi:hypothetical protein